jgi:hypothetical protein
MFQMMIQNKMQQIPQQMMGQLEQQLKRANPQMFKRYQDAKNSNNPNDLLNETINKFNPQQRQQWDNMMGMFNGGINSK